MSTLIACPYCMAELDVPAQFFGASMECPICENWMRLPMQVEEDYDVLPDEMGQFFIIQDGTSAKLWDYEAEEALRKAE